LEANIQAYTIALASPDPLSSLSDLIDDLTEEAIIPVDGITVDSQ